MKHVYFNRKVSAAVTPLITRNYGSVRPWRSAPNYHTMKILLYIFQVDDMRFSYGIRLIRLDWKISFNIRLPK